MFCEIENTRNLMNISAQQTKHTFVHFCTQHHPVRNTAFKTNITEYIIGY